MSTRISSPYRINLGPTHLTYLFHGPVAIAYLGLGWPPLVALKLTLSLLVAWHWSGHLAAKTQMATRAGGWALAMLLETGVLAIAELIGVPSIAMTFLLTALLIRAVIPSAIPKDSASKEPYRLFQLLAAATVLVAAWGGTQWTAMTALANGETPSIWQDWFYHGSLIDMLGQSATNQVHDIRSVTLPLQPYHYLSYGIAGWLASDGYGGLNLALTHWWPTGMLLLVAAGSEWVARLRPESPKLSLLLPLTLFFPDAAMLGSGQSFLSWHWLQMISPGALYGSAGAMLLASWLRVSTWKSPPRSASWTALIGVSVVIVLVFYKAQILILAAPLLAFWWAGVLVATRRIAWQWLAAMIALAVLVARGPSVPGLPLLHLGAGGLADYWPALLRLQEEGWLSGYTYPMEAPMVILLGTLGWTILGVFAWKNAPPSIRAWMTVLLSGYLLYALGLDLDTRGGAGTPEELQHRPLVWVMPMWWLSTAPYLFANCAQPLDRSRKLSLLVIVAVVFLGITAGLRYGPTAQIGPTALAGTAKLPAGLAEAARFIKLHREPGEVCQDADADPQFQWSAMSECPPFWINFNVHPRSSALVRDRAELWQHVQTMTPEARLATLRELGVAWYSAKQPTWLQGDGETSVVGGLPLEPAFKNDGYAVYQVSH